MDRVRIPTDLNDQDVFFAWGPIKLTLQQLILLFAGMLMWYGAADYMLRPIFGLNLMFGLLACLWILLIAIALAFMKVRGRPLDVWCAEKLSFIFGPRTFVLRDPNATGGLEADLHEDADTDALIENFRRDRRNS